MLICIGHCLFDAPDKTTSSAFNRRLTRCRVSRILDVEGCAQFLSLYRDCRIYESKNQSEGAWGQGWILLGLSPEQQEHKQRLPAGSSEATIRGQTNRQRVALVVSFSSPNLDHTVRWEFWALRYCEVEKRLTQTSPFEPIFFSSSAYEMIGVFTRFRYGVRSS